MIRHSLVVFALAVLWPSAAPAGRDLPVAGGTVSDENAESRGGLRLAGGFDLSRIGAKSATGDGPSAAKKPLRRNPLAAAHPLTLCSAPDGASRVPKAAGAHPFFDSTAPPLA